MDILEFLRSFSLFGYAVFDFVVSFGMIYIFAPRLSKRFLKMNIRIPVINWYFFILPFGILVHIAFQQITPMTRDFLDMDGFYFLKVLIIVLLVLSFRNIEIIKK